MPPDHPAGPPRVFFYVQHLLGIGHLHRAARVAKAMAADGFRVLLALGGPATPSLDAGAADILQLPPLKSGPQGFADLVALDGRPLDAAGEAARRSALLQGFDRFTPDVLITEAFPFGRRQMRFELLPLLAHAQAAPHPPLVAASVRDILQRGKRPDRAAETVGLVARFYDLVLVHGDPGFSCLETSFPGATAFAGKIAYTGIVAPEPSGDAARTGALGAVVSVGGGAVGAALIEAALAARPMTRLADRPWLVLTGPNGADQTIAAAAPEVRFARFVPDLAGVLATAEVSVSQAGYNTVADILAADCRAVLVPFAADGETEQSDRARLLQERGRAVTLAERDLTPTRLAAAIDDALAQPRATAGLDLDGARATGRILRRAILDRGAKVG